MRILAASLLAFACASKPAPTPKAEPAPPAPKTGAASSTSAASASPASAKAMRGSLETRSMHSAALGVDKSYMVYLPPGYATSQRRYPVVYMLHGLGGDEDDWSKMGLVSAAESVGLEALVVMVDGDDGFYVDSKREVNYDECLASKRPFGRAASMATYCVKAPLYETYIVKDMVAHVDETYRTVATRDGRAIGGLSMGGYGALNLAMRNSEVFSSAASHSGAAALLYGGPVPYERGKTQLIDDPSVMAAKFGPIGVFLISIFGSDIGFWRENDPAHLANSLEDGRISLYMDCGTEDELRLQHGASYLHEVLESRGITHEFALVPGRHNAAFWADRIDESLMFHRKHFEARLAPQ